MSRKIIAHLLIGFLNIIPLLATDPHNKYDIQYITTDDGLANNLVREIIKTNDGFMWFATIEGLCRYDGKSMKVFKKDPEDSLSFRSSNISSLFEDSNRTLWAGSTGLYYYDPDHEKFIEVMDARGKSLGRVKAITEQENNVLLFGAGNGLYKMDLDEKKPVKIDSIGDNFTEITVIFEDSNKNLWLGTSNESLWLYRTKDSLVKKTIYSPQGTFVGDMRIDRMYEDSTGIWFGTYNNGLFVMDKHDYSYQSIELCDGIRCKRIRAITEDPHGNLWVGTRAGLFVREKGTDFFYLYAHREDKYATLNSSSVYCIYIDHNYGMWLGTFAGGVNYINLIQKRFSNLEHRPKDNESLNNEIVHSIHIDQDGKVWVGTEKGGVNVMHTKTGKFTYFKHEPGNTNSVSDNNIKAFAEDQEGNIWICTYRGGLDFYNKKTGQFKNFVHEKNNPNSVASNEIRQLLIDNRGRLWLGLNGGIDLYNPKTKKFKHLKPLVEDHVGAYMGLVEDIYEGRNGDIYVTYDHGLFICDIKTDSIRFIEFPKRADTYAIHEDKNGNFWLGTSSGLEYWYNNWQDVLRITMNDGLPSNYVYGILGDEDNNLWISTSKGMFKYENAISDPFKKDIVVFTKYDGIISNNFMPGAYFKDKQGNIYFGSIKGVTFFHPDQINKNPYPPKVVFTNLKLFNKSVEVNEKVNGRIVLDKSIARENKIVLTHRDYAFTIEFAALHYASPAENQYMYKLERFDKEWNYTDAERNFATYTNLKQGTYHFKVRAANSDDVWSSQPTTVTIEVLPPFWKSKIAFAIYGFLLIGLFIAVYKISAMRTNYLNKLKQAQGEIEKAIEINQAKLSFFTNVVHEFQTPLTLLAASFEQFLKNLKLDASQRKYAKIIDNNLKRLNILIDQLLYFRKTQSKVTNLAIKKTNIVALVKDIVSPFKSIAEKYNIEFTAYYFSHNQELWVDADKIEKIIGNLLMNAFKHTPSGGYISIDLSKTNYNFDLTPLKPFALRMAGSNNEALKITVLDTGEGMTQQEIEHVFERFYKVENTLSTARSGVGIGLELTKMLVEMHGGVIEVASEKGKGSSFSVYFRLGNLHFDEAYIVSNGNKDNTLLIKTDYDFIISEHKQEKVTGAKNEDFLDMKYKPIVLIVEDSNEMRNFVKENLNESYEVYDASNGQEGLEMADELLPDIIISDIIMPKMNGIEFCQKIKTRIETCHIPIVLLTRKAEWEEKIQGLEIGADDYIEKPFNMRFLLLKVKNILRLKESIKTHFSHNLENDQIESADISVYDKKLLSKCKNEILNNISNPDFSVTDLGNAVGFSRSQLYRKIMALTGRTPQEVIMHYRLMEAKKMLMNEKYIVSEVAGLTGFKSLSSFSTIFKNHFGVSPTKFVTSLTS